MIFAIDFDGTIVVHEFPKIGKLKYKSKEVINKLYENGHKIIIWTCRYLKEDLENVYKFLKENDIKFHKINENIEDVGFCPKPKVFAHVYIDDRNVFCQCVDWDQIEEYLKNSNLI